MNMNSADFYKSLLSAIGDSATSPPPDWSSLPVLSWPPSLHEIDLMLRWQQEKRYVERRKACSKQQDREALEREMIAELMPVLRQNLPVPYCPTSMPAR